MREPPAWAVPFSFPLRPVDDGVLATVAGTHAQELAKSLVRTYRAEIAGCGNGLVEHILEWCDAPASYDTSWDLAFGRAQLALTSSSFDPGEVAVRIALRLTETGVEGTWRGAIAPSTLRLGRLILPEIERVQVDWVGGQPDVRVHASNGATMTCARRAGTGDWVATGVSSLPSVGVTRSVYLFGPSPLPPADGGAQCFEGVDPVEMIDAPMTVALQEAFTVLAEGATEYLRWVERILRGILVSQREESVRLVSGSGDSVPGVIHLSYPAGTMDIAEVLIHECAHQYFYLLERVGPVDDGSDRRLYWSPPIRRDRPLSRVLMAYHALANVRLFYNTIRTSGVDGRRYVDLHEEGIIDSVAQLDKPLRGNPALTPIGRALYEPLASRIAALAA